MGTLKVKLQEQFVLHIPEPSRYILIDSKFTPNTKGWQLSVKTSLHIQVFNSDVPDYIIQQQWKTEITI